jgi:uncharacterized membrane protein YeaQ/YmgE (transglycosylase-associated protein family)
MSQFASDRLLRNQRLTPGAAAGWIAGVVVKGAGFGPLGNIVLGILGSIVAGFIFSLLGIAFLPG